MQFLKDYATGHYCKEIQEEFTKRFGCDMTIPQIKGKLATLNIKTGTNNHFKKGHVAHNKGKPMPDEVK